MMWLIVAFVVVWVIAGKLDQRRSQLPLDWFGQPCLPQQPKEARHKYVVRKCSRRRT